MGDKITGSQVADNGGSISNSSINGTGKSNDGSKILNYATAISIIVATIISIYSLVVSNRVKQDSEKQQLELNKSKGQIQQLENEIHSVAGMTANELVIGNLQNGDTISIANPTFNGKLKYGIPNNFVLYGALKLGNDYNFMSSPIDVEADGDWECQFSIGSGLGKVRILFVLCDKDAQHRLSSQFSHNDWSVDNIYSFGGMTIVESVQVFVK